MIKVNLNLLERVSQGDLLKNVEMIESIKEEEGEIIISKIIFPLVIVLTQDCDLNQDFDNRKREVRSNEDKYLLSIIVAPLYNIEHIYSGEHLKQLGLRMQLISKNVDKADNKFLRNNQNPRFHFLSFDSNVDIVDSVIDFKHYFTVNVEYINILKSKHFVAQVSELYRENISHRFANFLSRIGLPD